MRFTCRVLAVAAAGTVSCAAAWSQAGAEVGRPASVLPLASEPAPRVVVYPPLPEPLARGVVVVQYRADHMRIVSVFGKSALDVSPRLGHLHVTLDDGPATWAHTSADPIIIVGLKPGLHKLRIELADPNHGIHAGETLTFAVPEQSASRSHEHR